MSNKTIAKFISLVILFVGALTFASSCSNSSSDGRYKVNAADISPDYEKPVVVGYIESADVTESSGLTASLCQPDVFWTHNDSGSGPYLFAMTSKGKSLGTWKVSNARNDDWEDIGSYKSPDGTCYLYVGDIGNNDLDRPELKVYRVKEPSISSASASATEKSPLQTDPADATTFKYSDTPHNAESLLVHPTTGVVYVLTKRLDGPSLIFKVTPQFGSGQPVMAEKIGEISVPSVPNGLLTGGAISPDGKIVVLCDYSAGYELVLRDAANFDEIWKQKPIPVDLGDRKQGEAVTFSPDGKFLLATSEKKKAPIVEIKIK